MLGPRVRDGRHGLHNCRRRQRYALRDEREQLSRRLRRECRADGQMGVLVIAMIAILRDYDVMRHRMVVGCLVLVRVTVRQRR